MNVSSNSQGGSGVSPPIEPTAQAEVRTSHGAPAFAPPSRRSEAAAAKRIVAFFLFMILSLLSFHHLIQFGMRRVETGSFGVTNRIVGGQVNADIVISGSSRALTHYDPRIIQEITGRTAYNIGRNGSQTDMQLAVLKSYLLHNTPPKLVIHNLDSFSFVTTKEIYDPAQYLPYLDESPIYDAISKITPHAWKWKRFPLYGYAVEDMRFTWAQGVTALFGRQPQEDHLSGYQPRNTAWTGEFESFRELHADGVEIDVETQGVRDVEEVAKICLAHNISLLFVYSPEFEPMQDLTRNREEIFARFRALGSRYVAPVWDFSDSHISSDRSMFYNSQHLNSEGAAAFSTDLAVRLRVLKFGDPSNQLFPTETPHQPKLADE